MSNVLLFSDPHFGHENIARKRGFKSAEEHDELIISNWNSKVHKRDLVYLLGDITMEKGNYSVLGRLNGRKRVVGGNHDMPQHSKRLMEYVESISGMIKYKGFILTHCPIHETEVGRFIANIHGHLHEESLPDKRYINVSAEVVGFTPVLFEDLVKIAPDYRGFRQHLEEIKAAGLTIDRSYLKQLCNKYNLKVPK